MRVMTCPQPWVLLRTLWHDTLVWSVMTSSTWQLNSILPTGSTTKPCRYSSVCFCALKEKAVSCHVETEPIRVCFVLLTSPSCVSSKVLVQFAGIVLIKDESTSNVAATPEEKVEEKTTEEQEKNDDEGTPSKTAEEIAAEENGESPLIEN